MIGSHGGHRWPLWLVLTALPIGGCGEASHRDVAQRLDDQTTALIRAAAPMLGVLRDTTPTYVLGGTSTEDAPLGMIGDAVSGKSGKVYVLDTSWGYVSVHGDGGRVLSRSAGEGEGPGQLQSPNHIALGRRETTLWVADEARLLHLFRIAGVQLQFVGRLSTENPVLDVCTAGDRTFFLAPGMTSDEPALYEVGEDLSIVRAFGPPIPDSHPFVTWLRARGRLLCDERAGILVHLSEQTGSFRSFTFDGHQVGTGTLPGFVPLDVQVNERGGVLQDHERPHHILWDVAAIPRTGFLIQAGTVDASVVEERGFYRELVSFVLDPAGPVVARLNESLPWVLDITDTTSIIGSYDPAPILGIVQLP